MVMVLGLQVRSLRLDFHVITLDTLLTHIRASVINQHNLILTKMQECLAAGKISMGLGDYLRLSQKKCLQYTGEVGKCISY